MARMPSSSATICTLVHGLPIGGAEVLVARMVRGLSNRYRFIVACLDQVGELGEGLIAEGMDVVCLGRGPGFDWKCVHRLKRLFSDHSVDIVHAHQCTPFAYALATRFFGRRPPVLLTEHGRFFPDFPRRRRMLFNRLLTNSRDRFVAVGSSVRRALIDNEGLPPGRVQIIVNGVSHAVPTCSPAERATIRARLGVAEHEIVVVNVARLDPIKDHSTAVRAIRIAGERDPAIRMLIVGDGPERKAIEQAIRNEQTESRIQMLGLRSDVPELLAASDIFLLTSVSEGIPLTVLEAMGTGVPVVATNVGGLPEIVEHGKTGLLAPAGDAAGLADALVLLAKNAELRNHLIAQAKLRLKAEFSEARMIASYDEIYAEMLALSARPARRPNRLVDISTNDLESPTETGTSRSPVLEIHS
jgi:glycosyltransferase involved in cell wall biosynthesis